MSRTRSRVLPWVVGALAAGAVVGAAVRAQRREHSLVLRFPPRGRFIELSDGSRFHLLEAGDPDAPPVVLIHGSDGVLDNFSETIMDGLSVDLRVIAVDRPGHGWSTVCEDKRVGLAANVEAIREALHVIGVHRAVLVGHSYGSSVALRWALDHPDEVAGLVLLSPAAYFTWSRARTSLMHAPNLPVVGPALSSLLLPVLGPPALAVISNRIGFRRNPVPDAFARLSRAFYLRPSQFSAFAYEYANFEQDVAENVSRYGQIRVPTTILVGDDDPITTPQQQAVPLARAIPGARLTILPRLAHEIPWHASTTIVDAIRAVVAEAWPRAEARS